MCVKIFVFKKNSGFLFIMGNVRALSTLWDVQWEGVTLFAWRSIMLICNFSKYYDQSYSEFWLFVALHIERSSLDLLNFFFLFFSFSLKHPPLSFFLGLKKTKVSWTLFPHGTQYFSNARNIWCSALSVWVNWLKISHIQGFTISLEVATNVFLLSSRNGW